MQLRNIYLTGIVSTDPGGTQFPVGHGNFSQATTFACFWGTLHFLGNLQNLVLIGDYFCFSIQIQVRKAC